jgi:phosphoribosylanthranilate isomerase
MNTRTKICGLKTESDVVAAAAAGAAYVGFVFFEKSPRNISFEDAANLAQLVPLGMAKVALTVNADNAMLDELTAKVPRDMLQLHGKETPERVAEVTARYGLPVMKAIGVADATDMEQISLYTGIADQLLIDAKPPKGSVLPGGNGLAFDWRLLAGRRWATPWMLAGGLTPENVAQAVQLTGAKQVDVSSGVESQSGVKDHDKISAFCDATR